jgi:mRNA interferase RelE/StbE
VSEPCELRWSRSARRAVAEQLPEAVAAAVLELALGPLRAEPRRVGKPLHEPFAGMRGPGPLAQRWPGCWSARRADYRVVYTVDDDKHLVTVEVVKHRRDSFRG